jgi:hypothetical protein
VRIFVVATSRPSRGANFRSSRPPRGASLFALQDDSMVSLVHHLAGRHMAVAGLGPISLFDADCRRVGVRGVQKSLEF